MKQLLYWAIDGSCLEWKRWYFHWSLLVYLIPWLFTFGHLFRIMHSLGTTDSMFVFFLFFFSSPKKEFTRKVKHKQKPNICCPIHCIYTNWTGLTEYHDRVVTPLLCTFWRFFANWSRQICNTVTYCLTKDFPKFCARCVFLLTLITVMMNVRAFP